MLIEVMVKVAAEYVRGLHPELSLDRIIASMLQYMTPEPLEHGTMDELSQTVRKSLLFSSRVVETSYLVHEMVEAIEIERILGHIPQLRYHERRERSDIQRAYATAHSIASKVQSRFLDLPQVKK